MPKQPLTNAVDPVARNRLFKITQAEEVRHNPVAGGQHFTADLGVAGFIRLPQQPEVEGQKVVKNEQCN